MEGLLLEGTSLPWILIEDGIVILVGALGTWSATVGIGEEGGRWMEEGWNMGEDKLRRSSIYRTI